MVPCLTKDGFDNGANVICEALSRFHVPSVDVGVLRRCQERRIARGVNLPQCGGV